MDNDKSDFNNLVGYNADNNLSGQNHNNGMINKKRRNVDELNKLRNLIKRKNEEIRLLKLFNTKLVI